MRSMSRRSAAGALLAFLSPLGRTQSPAYPARPIRLVVPFAAGGPTDLAARMVADELAPSLGQPLVVENRPGAGGNIGAEAAAQSAADGYTLFWAQSATHGINPSLYAKLGYDVLRDFASVAVVASEPLVLVARPDFAANDIPGLVALAAARPGRLTFGSGGFGSTPHMAGELFARMSGTTLSHVPYKGNAPAVSDVMAGHIDLVFDGVNAALGHLRGGKLKALGVTSRARAELLPQVASISEALSAYEVTSWGGVAAPAGTPAAVIERLAAALQAMGDRGDARQRFARSGLQLHVSSPGGMDRFVREQIERWRPLVQASGVRVE